MWLLFSVFIKIVGNWTVRPQCSPLQAVTVGHYPLLALNDYVNVWGILY